MTPTACPAAPIQPSWAATPAARAPRAVALGLALVLTAGVLASLDRTAERQYLSAQAAACAHPVLAQSDAMAPRS
ncbi:hypothetical protein [Ideonella livida]|uniref:Uncharacterized protein n=1 Tax=Ideonella livida TaxID=2707176 RepID=A0A7C9PHN6_9BURK|nr:hypothetical protein [Ideonella livida]NDY92008.1 hypothetical protein [Ideonella livida]